MRGAVQRMDQGRATGMAELARHLDEQEALRPDVTLDQATDVLWLQTGFDSFDLLHTGRNLPLDQIATILTTTAERACADNDTSNGP
jgi:hypothetical protein